MWFLGLGIPAADNGMETEFSHRPERQGSQVRIFKKAHGTSCQAVMLRGRGDRTQRQGTGVP